MEAISRHLIDDVAVGWHELGIDLHNDAPPTLVAALTSCRLTAIFRSMA
ncbi:hypothetical protein ACIP79_02575 [Streptomyces sp. NPDC088747]